MYITQNKPLPLTYLQQKTDYLNNNQRISLERFLTVDVSFTNRAHRSWRNQQHVISSCVQHSPYYLLPPPSQGQWHVTPLLVPEPPLIEISATRCYKHLFNSCSPWLFLSGGQRTAKVSESFQWKPLQVAQNTAWHADGWGITPSWLLQGHLKQNLLPLTFLKIEEGFLEDIPWNTVQQGLLYSIVFVFVFNYTILWHRNLIQTPLTFLGLLPKTVVQVFVDSD